MFSPARVNFKEGSGTNYSSCNPKVTWYVKPCNKAMVNSQTENQKSYSNRLHGSLLWASRSTVPPLGAGNSRCKGSLPFRRQSTFYHHLLMLPRAEPRPCQTTLQVRCTWHLRTSWKSRLTNSRRNFHQAIQAGRTFKDIQKQPCGCCASVIL